MSEGVKSSLSSSFAFWLAFAKRFLYHDDFLTPGISPLFAISLKHILHKPNFLIYPLFLPHRKQRVITRVLYFGFLFAFTICDNLAMLEIVSEPAPSGRTLLFLISSLSSSFAFWLAFAKRCLYGKT